jgi:hypothetical protein
MPKMTPKKQMERQANICALNGWSTGTGKGLQGTALRSHINQFCPWKAPSSIQKKIWFDQVSLLEQEMLKWERASNGCQDRTE